MQRYIKNIICVMIFNSLILLIACNSNNNTDTELISAEINSGTEIIDAPKEELSQYSQENITNYDEAIFNFTPPSFHTDYDFGKFSTLFPSDLQVVLRHSVMYGDIDDTYCEKYLAECKVITSDEFEKYPFIDDMFLSEKSLLDKEYIDEIYVLDIDGDGEDEYVASHVTGTKKHTMRSVFKLIDDKWFDVGSDCVENFEYITKPGSEVISEILEYEGKYYLLLGNKLSYCKGEISNVDWETEDIPMKADCWESIELHTKIIDYMPIESYSQIQDDSIDFLENIDLADIKSNGEIIDEISWCVENKEVNYYSNKSFATYISWIQNHNGKEYKYVISRIRDGVFCYDDKILTIFKHTADEQLEVVKMYYLVANVRYDFIDSLDRELENVDVSEYIDKYVTLEEGTEAEDYSWMKNGETYCLRIWIQYIEKPEHEYQHKEDYFIFINSDEVVEQVLHVDYENKGIHAALFEGEECENSHSLGASCGFEAYFEDVTFDGNKDLIIFVGDGRRESYYCAYVYENEKYCYESTFEHIPSYEIDKNNKVIYGDFTNGLGTVTKTTYKYKKGKFVLTNEKIFKYINDEYELVEENNYK